MCIEKRLDPKSMDWRSFLRLICCGRVTSQEDFACPNPLCSSARVPSAHACSSRQEILKHGLKMSGTLASCENVCSPQSDLNSRVFHSISAQSARISCLHRDPSANQPDSDGYYHTPANKISHTKPKEASDSNMVQISPKENIKVFSQISPTFKTESPTYDPANGSYCTHESVSRPQVQKSEISKIYKSQYIKVYKPTLSAQSEHSQIKSALKQGDKDRYQKSVSFTRPKQITVRPCQASVIPDTSDQAMDCPAMIQPSDVAFSSRSFEKIKSSSGPQRAIPDSNYFTQTYSYSSSTLPSYHGPTSAVPAEIIREPLQRWSPQNSRQTSYESSNQFQNQNCFQGVSSPEYQTFNLLRDPRNSLQQQQQPTHHRAAAAHPQYDPQFPNYQPVYSGVREDLPSLEQSDVGRLSPRKVHRPNLQPLEEDDAGPQHWSRPHHDLRSPSHRKSRFSSSASNIFRTLAVLFAHN